MAHLGLSLHTVTGNCMIRKNMFFSVWGMFHFQVLQSNYYLIRQWTFNDHIFFFCSLLLMVILDDCFSHSNWYLLRKQFLISSLDWKQNKKKIWKKIWAYWRNFILSKIKIKKYMFFYFKFLKKIMVISVNV